MVVGKLEHTRKEPFSLKTRLFPSSLGFFFSQTFCSVFVTLIILTCYFCKCVCVFLCVSVWVLFVCWKNRLRYQKTAVLGWGKQFLFLINTSTVYNNICVYYAQFSSAEYKSSQTLHWFVFVHHHRLYILSWCSPLSRWEGRLSRSFCISISLIHFYMEIITLRFVCTCVNLCFSQFSSLLATTKIDYMKYLLLCMCFSCH